MLDDGITAGCLLGLTLGSVWPGPLAGHCAAGPARPGRTGPLGHGEAALDWPRDSRLGPGAPAARALARASVRDRCHESALA